MRFPLAPLLAAIGDHRTHRDVAATVGVELSTVRKWVIRGLSTDQADRLAMTYSLHPSEVWPDWPYLPERECENELCREPFVVTQETRRFCCRRCGLAVRYRASRNQQADPGDPQRSSAEVAA